MGGNQGREEEEKEGEWTSRPLAAIDAPPASVDEDVIENKTASENQIEENESIKHGGVTQDDEEKTSSGLPSWIWISGLIIVIAIILWLFSDN